MGNTNHSLSLPPLQQQLLYQLADGAFHSGTELGRDLGVSRAAVWKALGALSEFGLEIHAVKGRGYRLAYPLQLLQREIIEACLSEAMRRRLCALEVLQIVDSTNAHLMRGDTSPAVCLAEFQTSGRGRRGRRWISPYGSNIYMSLRWRFDDGMARLAGLSLAAGVAVMRALREVGVAAAGLKWPNDILWDGRKLGGILLEVRGESAGPCHVVLGLGLNLCIAPRAAADIDQPWVSLDEVVADVDRNHLAARLIEHLISVLSVFEREGLHPFIAEWRSSDLFFGERVTLLLPGEQVSGICRGIAADGSLLLEAEGQLCTYSYGEVSMRRTETLQ